MIEVKASKRTTFSSFRLNRNEMRRLIKKALDFTVFALITFLGIRTVFLIFKANLNFSEHLYFLHMDELVIADGVSKILHSESIGEFYWNITNGGDQRYGRLLWNVSALVSFLPWKFFDEQGQILATRFLSVGLAVASFILISISLFRSKIQRLAFFVLLLNFPFTSYYTTMPKPEPIAIFCLALLYYLCKKQEKKIVWILFLTGILIGTKVSFYVFALGVIGFLFANREKTSLFNRFKTCYFALISGLTISVPMLWFLLLPLFVFRMRTNSNFTRGVSFSISLLAVLLIFRDNLKTYISATFGNTSHGSDDSGINFVQWFKYVFDTWMFSSAFFLFVFFFLLLLIFRRLNKVSSYDLVKSAEFWFLASSIVLTLGIFSTIDRLWGMYLWIPTILLTGICLSLASEELSTLFNRRSYFSVKDYRELSIVCLLLLNWIFSQQTSENLESLSKRDSRPEHLEQVQIRNMISSELVEMHFSKNKNITVSIDPLIYRLPEFDWLTQVRFWGPFTEIFKNRDAVILTKIHLNGLLNTNEDSERVETQNSSRNGIEKFFKLNAEDCERELCYVLTRQFADGTTLWTRNWITE